MSAPDNDYFEGTQEREPTPPKTIVYGTTHAGKRMGILNELCRENLSRIDIKTSYKINPKKLLKWVNMQPTELLQELAGDIAKKIRHIPYDEFVETLSDVIHEIRTEYIPKLRQTGTVPIPLLVIPGDSQIVKSYLWMLMLANTKISDKISEWIHGIVFNFRDVMQVCEQVGKEHSDFTPVLIFLDDAIYSGNQLSEFIEQVFSDISGFGNIKAVEYVVASPYITRHGMSAVRESFKEVSKQHVGLVQTKPRIFFPAASITMDIIDRDDIKLIYENAAPFERFVLTKYFPADAPDAIPEPEDYLPRDITATYFDHKMPDSLSSISRILIFGEVWTDEQNWDTVKSVNFIDGCSHMSTKYFANKDDIDLDGQHKDEDFVCPMAFYKKVKWTFGGYDLNLEKMLSDLFDNPMSCVTLASKRTREGDEFVPSDVVKFKKMQASLRRMERYLAMRARPYY